jgi:hypothetical protein
MAYVINNHQLNLMRIHWAKIKFFLVCTGWHVIVCYKSAQGQVNSRQTLHMNCILLPAFLAFESHSATSQFCMAVTTVAIQLDAGYQVRTSAMLFPHSPHSTKSTFMVHNLSSWCSLIMWLSKFTHICCEHAGITQRYQSHHLNSGWCP